MAFEGLSDRLQEVFRKLRGKGKITEEDVKALAGKTTVDEVIRAAYTGD